MRPYTISYTGPEDDGIPLEYRDRAVAFGRCVEVIDDAQGGARYGSKVLGVKMGPGGVDVVCADVEVTETKLLITIRISGKDS